MTIAAVIAFCVVLALLAFLVPKLSRHPERLGQGVVGAGGRLGGKAPGPLGRLLSKSANSSSKAISRSGSGGRKARGKMPF